MYALRRDDGDYRERLSRRNEGDDSVLRCCRLLI